MDLSQGSVSTTAMVSAESVMDILRIRKLLQLNLGVE